jgi:hypothetical protein
MLHLIRYAARAGHWLFASTATAVLPKEVRFRWWWRETFYSALEPSPELLGEGRPGCERGSRVRVTNQGGWRRPVWLAAWQPAELRWWPSFPESQLAPPPRRRLERVRVVQNPSGRAWRSSASVHSRRWMPRRLRAVDAYAVFEPGAFRLRTHQRPSLLRAGLLPLHGRRQSAEHVPRHRRSR